MSAEVNKRIAKNTFYLYIRMLLTMVVTLYTSRVVLNTLGVDDFGIYNLIGGIVLLFVFLNTSMSNATQRFLNYELGKEEQEGNSEMLRRTFSISMTAHISIALLALLLAETVGLWLVNTLLNIPEGREAAANWVYQFAILTFIVNIVRVPYNASIIAYEKMSFFAYLSIFEVILKLGMVYLLVMSEWDKLILYSILMFGVALCCNIVYRFYCRRKFQICRYKFLWDKEMYFNLMGFSGWSMLGGAANIGAQHGGNILINIFSGVTANAAFGVSNQVSTAIYSFVNNFQQAFNPQIVKLYVANERDALYKLVFRTSLFSFYLLLIIAIPLTININTVLILWLKQVPEYSAVFCTLMIGFYLIEAIQIPLWMTIMATGKIKWYAILIDGLTLLNLPISFLLLLNGMPPAAVLVTRMALNLVTAIVRTIYIKYHMQFPSGAYFRQVILRAVTVMIVAFGASIFIKGYFSDSLPSFFIVTLLSIAMTAVVIYTLGISTNDRKYLTNALRSKLKPTR